MGKLAQDKRFILFFFVLAVTALVMLASGLNSVTLRRSQYEIIQAEETKASEKPMGGFTEIFIPQWLIVAAAALLIGLFILVMLTPRAREHFLNESLWRLLAYLVVFVTIFYGLKAAAAVNEIFADMFAVSDIRAAPPAEGNIEPLNFAPASVQPSDSFLLAIMLLIALILSAVLWRSYLWWQAQKQPVNPLDEIANMARVSLRELALQTPSRDAIINCYENMSQAVTHRRGLDRKATMTASEFAHKLRRAGLPDEPVNRLTRLFESARYSTHAATQKDIDEAVLCLTAILHYCGEKQ